MAPARAKQPFKLPGWTMLVALVIGMVALVYYPWRGDQEFRDIEFSTWSCERPIAGGASWQDYLAAGCAPSAVAAEVVMFQGGAAEIEPDSADDWGAAFEGVPMNSPELSMALTLREPSGQVVLALSEQGAVRDLNGDASGTRWTGYFPPRQEASSFVLLVGPAE